jgi:hypothetical protein
MIFFLSRSASAHCGGAVPILVLLSPIGNMDIVGIAFAVDTPSKKMDIYMRSLYLRKDENENFVGGKIVLPSRLQRNLTNK